MTPGRPDAALRTHGQALEALRLRRAELRESMSALEQALAAPAPGRQQAWAERVHVALVELSGDFREHVDVAEGPQGLYRQVLDTTPRLAHAVAHLTSEHAEIDAALRHLLARIAPGSPAEGSDDVRDLGTALLGRLIRSRQRSADLVYEAYESDIGGES